MTQVRWTTQAADDLQGIYDFIARDSPQYAQLIVEGILATVDSLEQFPLLGRTVPERERPDLRELIRPPYRLIYRITDVIDILTIIRSSRMFPSDVN